MITIQLTKRVVSSALAVVVVLGLMGGAWLLTKEFFKPKAVAEEGNKKEVTMDMESFVVNLADPNGGRYLRASLSLALNDEADRQLVRRSSARIRDGLITLLSGKTAENLLAAEGKSELRNAIVEQINAATGRASVEAVYFREFLIQ
jgi:flagellar protein FliL